MTPIASDPWAAVTAARIPLQHLDALAAVRDRPDVRVTLASDSAWVRWSTSHASVVNCLLPVPGVELFTTKNGEWYPFGRRVPGAVRPPDDEGDAISRRLLPQAVEPRLPANEPIHPVSLRLVRTNVARPVSALVCPLTDLRTWCDSATTAELQAVQGALSGDRAILLGKSLPSLRGSVRYWGQSLLTPLGFRPDPGLAESLIRAAVGASDHELVFLDEQGIDIVPRGAFSPLTRAGIRLALLARPSPGEAGE